MAGWYGMGLEESMSSRQSSIAKERPRVCTRVGLGPLTWEKMKPLKPFIMYVTWQAAVYRMCDYTCDAVKERTTFKLKYNWCIVLY